MDSQKGHRCLVLDKQLFEIGNFDLGHPVGVLLYKAAALVFVANSRHTIYNFSVRTSFEKYFGLSRFKFGRNSIFHCLKLAKIKIWTTLKVWNTWLMKLIKSRLKKLFRIHHNMARMSWCGNYRIFLRLRFYVKSKLVNLESQNLPLWLIERLWILNYMNFCTFWRLKFSKLTKI